MEMGIEALRIGDDARLGEQARELLRPGLGRDEDGAHALAVSRRGEASLVLVPVAEVGDRAE